jgi:predicted enzyme related to lactoylglutathione lyase
MDNGRFVWYELLAQDPKSAIDFYTDVVGWKTQPFDEAANDYEMWVGSQGPLGGVMKLPDEAAKMGVPPHWMSHVQVENVGTTASLVKKLGGKIYKEEEVPTVGRFAIIGDPQGASLSIFTPNSPMTLHDSSKSGEFCWNELMTSDHAAAFNFYSQLFGWKVVQDMDMGPMGTYRVFGIGERQLGGMMTVPKGAPMPPMWLYYAEVPDLDAALARATKKGATTMNGPMDVPGGGRIAQLMDPQRAAFCLHQSPKK